jgi:hypothetical protein
MIRAVLFAAFAILSVLPATSRGELLDYWSFNNETLDADPGAATLTATWEGVGIDIDTFEAGTTVNAQLGEDALWALTYVDPVAAFSQHKLTLSGLDFTGLSGISISYAVRTTHVFDVNETATISYQINGGSWVTAPTDIATPMWELRTTLFGSALNNASNVSIRIEHNALFEAGSTLKFDNLTVTSVPEPTSTAIVLVAAVVAISLVRKRRRERD